MFLIFNRVSNIKLLKNNRLFFERKKLLQNRREKKSSSWEEWTGPFPPRELRDGRKSRLKGFHVSYSVGPTHIRAYSLVACLMLLRFSLFLFCFFFCVFSVHPFFGFCFCFLLLTGHFCFILNFTRFYPFFCFLFSLFSWFLSVLFIFFVFFSVYYFHYFAWFSLLFVSFDDFHCFLFLFPYRI